jgi:iron-sulfur cluster assembly protein
MTDTITYEAAKSGKNTNVVYITQGAGERIKSDLENGEHLRLQVAGGGCSGLSYELFSEESEKLQDIDTLIDYRDFKVVIDQKSIIYLKGMELDYDGSMQGKGFVFRNPNAASTCGCGESFSVV